MLPTTAGSYAVGGFGGGSKQQPQLRAADLRRVDDQGWAAIHHAAFRGYVKSIDRFVRADAELALTVGGGGAGSAAAADPAASTAINEERLLEITTSDGLQFSPLHLAVMGGHVEAVRCLVELGARRDSLNARQHGVVELAAFGRHIPVLRYLLQLESAAGETPGCVEEEDGENEENASASSGGVWKRLVAFMESDTEDESTSATESVRGLLLSAAAESEATSADDDGGKSSVIDFYLRQAYSAGVVNVAVKLIKSTEANSATKEAALSVVNCLMTSGQRLNNVGKQLQQGKEEATANLTVSSGDSGHCSIAFRSRDDAVATGIIPGVIKLLTKSTPQLVRLSSQTLTILTTGFSSSSSSSSSYSEAAATSSSPRATVTGQLAAPAAAGPGTGDAAKRDRYAAEAVERGAVAALAAALSETPASDTQTLVDLIDALGNVVDGSQAAQNALAAIDGAVQVISNLYDTIERSAELRKKSVVTSSSPLPLSLTRTVSKLVRDHADNQTAFVDAGVTSQLVALLRYCDVTLQAAAIDAVLRLADGNAHAQRRFVGIVDDEADDVITALLNIVTRQAIQSQQLRNLSREHHLQHQRLCVSLQRQAARAVWQLTGSDVTLQRRVAERIGVKRLLEFVDLPPGVVVVAGSSGGNAGHELQFVGSEALGALCRSADAQPRNEAHDCGAVQSLVRLLRSDSVPVVLSAVRTLRRLVVGVGYRSHRGNQAALLEARGVRLLVALASHADDRRLRAEAFHTLACASLGCTEIMDELQHNSNFSFRRLVTLLQSTGDTPLIQAAVGSAVATFGFNNIANQKAIVDGGTVNFSTFLPLLRSEDPRIRCRAAFQVVVLARIMPDIESAVSSAAGIKLLVDAISSTVDTSNSTLTAAAAAADNECNASSWTTDIAAQSLAADCIARLAHTRHGIREAFVAISAIQHLTDLLQSPCELVRGNSAVALGYLSANHLARRQLLKRCRHNPALMAVLTRYSDCTQFSPNLFSDWQHYKQFLKLPSINYDGGRRINIIASSNSDNTSSRRASNDSQRRRLKRTRRRPATQLVLVSVNADQR